VDPLVRPLAAADLDAVVALALRAWEPVFASLETALGPRVYPLVLPDWRAAQAAAVRATCTDRSTRSGPPTSAGAPRGSPPPAVAWIEAQGVALAIVATGGDPGHAPARALYERLGFAPLHQVRSYRAL